MRQPLRLAGATLIALGSVAAITAPGCNVSVGDQKCYQDSDPQNKDDDCPYGPPGGPAARTNGAAVDTCPNPDFNAPTGCAEATFEAVYAMMVDETRGKCSLSGCHGMAPGKKAFYFPGADPALAYANMGKYTNEQGEPYALGKDADVQDGAKGPETSWVACNVSGVPGSAPMPPKNGLLDPADVLLVKNWASCGFPGPGAAAGQGGN